MLRGIDTCPFIPTSVTCQQGFQAVQEMDSIFQGAPASIQARFQSAHDSIMAEYNSYSSLTCYIELYNGAVCSLGVQATQLANRIQSAMGQETTPGAPTGAFDLSSLIGLPGLLIGGIVLYFIFEPKFR